VAHLRWLQAPHDVLAIALWIVDDDLDRLEVVGDPAGGGATSMNELGQFGAQGVGERLVEAHPHEAALLPGQAEPVIKADRDMNASANQPPRTVRAPQAAALLRRGSRRFTAGEASGASGCCAIGHGRRA